MGFMNFFSSLFEGSDKEKVSTEVLNDFVRDLKLIRLPEDVVNLTDKVVLEECKEIYSALRALDYKKNITKYNELEWNSWEVSLLMDMYNRNLDFKLHDIKEVLTPDILKLSFSDLTANVKGLVRKYEKSVNMEKGKLLLKKQKIWSAKEISSILYYLVIFKSN